MRPFYKTLYSFTTIVVLVLLSAFQVLSQNVTVTGTVLDEYDNSGLPGVNILVKDAETATGTVTDFEGNFSLNTEVGAVLVFSFTGYSDKEVTVTGEEAINITLGIEEETLNEIVVIGYGAVAKKDLTGVVTKVGEEEFNKGVISSPDKLLAGKVAGLSVVSSGEPGGDTRIRLRGQTSIGADSEPLIVIDGVPLDNDGVTGTRNPLNFINPADVADITILKDASAAAIYGARGASGVIVITTKSGSKGKPKVAYDGYFSISNFVGEPAIFNTAQFRQAINAKAPQALFRLGESDTDWVGEVTQAATSQRHNLSIRGGFKKLNYYLSLGYLDSEGVIKTSENTNTNIGLNLSTKLLKDHLSINFRTKIYRNRDRFSPDVMGAAMAFDPTQSVLDADSEYGGYFQWNDILATKNPVASLMQTANKGKGIRFLNNLEVEYKLPFAPAFSIKSNISSDFRDGDRYEVKEPTLRENAVTNGLLIDETEYRTSDLIETYGTFKKDFGHSKIDITAGHGWQENDNKKVWTEGDSLVMADNKYGFERTANIKTDSLRRTNRLISFFGRVNYTIGEKYLFTASLRRDGSSRFGEKNRWGYFPAAAFAWRVLQEDFANGLNNIFTDLKLRLSYGQTGTESIDDYLYTIFYSYGNGDAAYQFGDEYVPTLRGIGVDPDIKWESTSSYNVGIDFGILNNRLTGSIDVYKKFTNDLLFDVAAAAFTNLSDRITTNISEMENSGIELALNSYIVDRTNFDWKLGFTAAYNKNEVTKLDNSNLPEFGGYEVGDISGDVGQTIQILKVGEPYFAFRTYEHILDANGNPITDTEDRNGDDIENELDMYVDQNNDGLINEADLVVGESPFPDFVFGLTSNMSYKNFDLSFTLRSNVGNHVYNNVASGTGFFERLSDRRTNNIHTSAFETNFKDRQLKSDYYIENASFIKLDNVSLGYTLNKIKYLNDIRVYATVQNLLTISGYSGVDPEAPLINGGIDNNLYPYSLTYLFGLSASF